MQAAHSVIISVAADAPFIHTRATPLETAHAAFVTGLLHQARLVLSMRQLDTGVAKDVTGVLRITSGAGEWDEMGRERSESLKDAEFLYYVAGDGGVRVFERGT